MHYTGGKHLQSKHYAAIIRWMRTDQTRYIEPMVGAASVMSKLDGVFRERWAGDIVPDLLMFWNAVVNEGYEPPLEMSKDQWRAIKEGDPTPSPLRAWAGFAASFRGSWFGGYGGSTGDHNYLPPQWRTTLKKIAGLQDVQWRCQSYEEWDQLVDQDTIVYCDPPYANTRGYNATDGFDHQAFWATMERWSRRGALVLVSEYVAPIEWTPVFSREDIAATTNGKPKRTMESIWMLPQNRVCGLCGYQEGPDAEAYNIVELYDHEMCSGRGGHRWIS